MFSSWLTDTNKGEIDPLGQATMSPAQGIRVRARTALCKGPNSSVPAAAHEESASV